MKIQCILERKGGTYVEMPGKLYHFAPQDDGKHVSEVSIESHIERFLSIPEAYRMLRTAKTDLPATFAAKVEDAPIESVKVNLLAAPGYPESFEIEGKTYALEAIVARAYADSGVTAENWNELPEDTRATKLDIVLDAIADGEIVMDESAPAPKTELPPADSVAEPTRKELIVLYEAKFGKKPSNATSIEAIKAKLAE